MNPNERKEMFEYKRGHVEIGPSGQKLLYCPHEGCDKVLTSSPGLRYHMRTHSGNDRPFHCNRCKKTFKSANGLKYHKEKTKCEITIDVTSVSHHSAGHTIIATTSSREEIYPDDDVEVDVVSTTQPLDIQSWRQRTVSDSSYLTVSPTPYSNTLDHTDQEEIVNPLTQLAIIATGPQSPLLHNNQALTDYQRASQNFNASIHSYAKPPRSNHTSPVMSSQRHHHPYRKTPVISRKRSLSFSGPESKYSSDSTSSRESTASSDDDSPPESSSTGSEIELEEVDNTSNYSEENNNNEVSWPQAKWQCFVSGTSVRIENGIITNWKRVEDRFEEKYLDESYAPHGLKLEKVLSKTPILHLVFSPVHESITSGKENSLLYAQCQLDHPFFVKDKGWCSIHPSLTEDNYGLQCTNLDINDVCLPPHHPDATFTRKAVQSLTSLRFTPEDSHAVFALSQMARTRKKFSSLEELSRSYPRLTVPSNKKKSALYNKNSQVKAKRPMNAFMLFAKKYRVEYTQQYPGKDNRAISVLLGEKWKKMKNDERKGFSQEAKKLAEQYRKQNPDCWKRKRSISESFIS